MVNDDNDNKIYLTTHDDERTKIIKGKEKHNIHRKGKKTP